jgi:ElaB/YqjD/DUF883 family membrane-anchored ribosome-binding protein
MTTKARHNGHRTHYNLSNDVEKIKAALYHTTQDLKGRAGEMVADSMDNAKEQTAMVRDNVADYTSERPFKALGIALVAGIAIGFLLRK